MKLGDWRTIGGPGVLPLQVKGAHTFSNGGSSGAPLNQNNIQPMSASNGGILGVGAQAAQAALSGTNGDENNNLWERPCLFGVRITGRDEATSSIPIGSYIEDVETRGDVLGSTFWNRATRDIGFWRFSTPVVTGDEVKGAVPADGDADTPTGKEGGASGSNVPTGGGGLAAKGAHCAEQDKFHIGPVKKITDGDEWVQDKRVESISPILPKDADGNKLWPKFPKEYFGIVLAADWEDEQQELFHPTDPRMIAVNRKGDPEMGSLVCDMADDDFKIDSERMARLQAFEWVIKKPTSEYVSFYGRNSIAWNIGQSGCADVRGGLIKDVDSNSLGTPSGTPSSSEPNDSISVSDWGGGGGGSEGPLGLVSQRQSGPFEIPCKKHKVGKDDDGNEIYSTHLSLNSYFSFPSGFMDGPLKHDGFWKAPDEAPETAYVFFQYDPSLSHPFIGGTEYGKHRWWAQTNKYQPPWRPPVWPPPDMPTVPPITPDGSTTVQEGLTTGGGSPGEEVPTGSNNPNLPTGEPNPQSWWPSFGWEPEGPLPVRPDTMQTVTEYLPDQGFLRYQYSSMEEGGNAYIWRPQRFQRREGDWRKTASPDRTYRRYTADVTSPITARLESWGAQGLRHADGDSPMDLATDWIYTHRPNSYRYLSGTASGGVCLLPPETDLADIGNALEPLSGADKSVTHFMTGPGSRFGAGLPDLFSGGIERGYSWFDGTVGGQSGGLIFATNLQSTKTDRIFFEHSTGLVGLNEENPALRLHCTDDSIAAAGARIENQGSATFSKAVSQVKNNTGITCEMSVVSSGWPAASIPNVSGAQLITDSRSLYLATTATAGTMVFVTGGSSMTTNERMRITSVGDVGINEPSPDCLLHLHSETASGPRPTDLDIVKIESDLNILSDEFGILFTANSIDRAEIKAKNSGLANGNLELKVKGASMFTILSLENDGNVGINGQSYGGADGAVFIGNAGTLPTSTPSGGGILYVRGGALWWRGSSGTDTLLASA
jgi:hypothetical protein